MDTETMEVCNKLRCEIGKIGHPGAFGRLEVLFNEDSQVIAVVGEVDSWYLKQLLIAASQRATNHAGGFLKLNGDRLNRASITNGKKIYRIDLSQVVVVGF